VARITSPRSFLAPEPGRIRNAVVSLDHCLEATSDESLHSRIDQQADWVIGELRHAINQIERAKTAVAAARALAATPPVEMGAPELRDAA